MYWKRYGKLLFAIPLLLAILVFAASMLYSVDADSEGVRLRFGRYVDTARPGLHLKLPWPVEVVHEVPVQRIQTLEFGFRTVEPGRVTVYERTEEDEAVALMLTGGLNLAHVEWIVQYRIKDARNYLFKIGGQQGTSAPVEDAIRDVSESVMRTLVGDRSVDEVITIGREQIADDAEVSVQQMLDQFEAGVDVVTVKLQASTPPDEVKDAFDEVNRARQHKERVINDARGERNRVIPAARGERDRAISEAEGYKKRAVSAMRGRAKAFESRLASFQKAPDVTQARLYVETMEEVLSAVDHKIVIDGSMQTPLTLLRLDEERPAPATREGGNQ
jgi:membrane protease subunit HflK